MRTSTLALVLSLCPLLACPRPTDTDPKATPGDANGSAPVADPNSEPTTGETPPAEDPAPTAAPASGTLTVDKSQSEVGFAVARATIGHVGKFEGYDASLTLADAKPVGLEISVETGSVVADRAGLTIHLKSPDFFDVDKFPTATFTATEFTPDPEAGPDAYTIAGTMRLHGVEQKLEFPATLEIGPDQVVGRATLDISAKAFGIAYEGMEAELAEDAVQLEIELVFPRVAGGPPEN